MALLVAMQLVTASMYSMEARGQLQVLEATITGLGPVAFPFFITQEPDGEMLYQIKKDLSGATQEVHFSKRHTTKKLMPIADQLLRLTDDGRVHLVNPRTRAIKKVSDSMCVDTITAIDDQCAMASKDGSIILGKVVQDCWRKMLCTRIETANDLRCMQPFKSNGKWWLACVSNKFPRTLALHMLGSSYVRRLFHNSGWQISGLQLALNGRFIVTRDSQGGEVFHSRLLDKKERSRDVSVCDVLPDGSLYLEKKCYQKPKCKRFAYRDEKGDLITQKQFFDAEVVVRKTSNNEKIRSFLIPSQLGDNATVSLSADRKMLTLRNGENMFIYRVNLDAI